MKQMYKKPAILWLAAFLTLSVSACSTAVFDEEGDEAVATAVSATEQVRSGAAACQEGDQMVASESQCLQDDAACYPLNNGKWCTGSRAAKCPKGSEPAPAGACPSGAVCFGQSESLRCMMKRS